MGKYVWTAKDPSGSPVVREIEANSIEESKSALQAEGCTELELKSEEVMEVATAGMPRKFQVLGKEVEITAAERLKHRGKRPPTILSALGRGIAQSKWFFILMLIIAAWEFYRGRMTSLILTGAGVILWLVFLVVIRTPGIYYGRLHKAADWYRWQEVLDIVDRLKQIGKFHFIKIPPLELGRQRAKALAGLGRLTEAVAEFSEFENQPNCPGWMYKASLAGIHDIAKQHTKAVAYNLDAIREKPTAVLYLDLANRYVRYLKDPDKARAALAETEKETLMDIAKPFLFRCRGILAFLEGDNTTAKQEFEASLAAMEKFPHVPYRDGHISVTKAYLCCVLANQGDVPAAKRNFMAAKEYLVATGETELLERCQRATSA